MRTDLPAPGRGLVLLAVVVASAACGRLGYDPIAADAGGGAGRGGSSGAGGLGTAGTGGSTGGGAAGAGATGGVAGGGGTGGATGAGGSVGGGAAGTGGAAGAGGSTGGGGASGAGGGGGAISCASATFGGHDYLFCDGKVDWATARADCERRGMRLARIDDAAEDNWLQVTVSFSASMFRRESLWLGGYEPTTDGDWHWTDGAAFWLGGATGTAVGGLFTNWDSNEPNNAVGPEACLAMPLNKTTWWDYQCSALAYYACELY
jgi:hypothetical protein